MDKLEAQFFKEQSRADLLAYAVYCDKFFEISPHHILIADHLDKLMKWDTKLYYLNASSCMKVSLDAGVYI